MVVDVAFAVYLAFNACTVCCVCLGNTTQGIFQAVGALAALWNRSSALF